MDVKCCKCKKGYDLGDNIFGYDKANRPILICPHCGSKHLINFMPFEKRIEVKKVKKLDLAGPELVILGASRIANASRVDQSESDNGDVTGWTKTDDFILATRIYTSKGPIARAYRLRWKVSGGEFADVSDTGAITYSAVTDLGDGTTLEVGNKLCDAQGGYSWQNGLESEGDNLLPDSGTYSLADEYYTEFQWALDCNGAADGGTYEFELWDVTEGVSIGTCAASIRMRGPADTPPWKSPTGFNDPSTHWYDEKNAYDNLTDTYAMNSVGTQSWGNYLELTISAISCSKVRFWAYYGGDDDINQISLDVYYSGDWHNIYEGAYTHLEYVEKEIGSTQIVTAMRMKFYNSTMFVPIYAKLYEADFYEVVAGDFEYTGTGTFTYSGTATQTYTKNYLTSASGQFTSSGSAEQVYSKNYLFEGSGELAFSGESVIIFGLAFVGSGSLAYSGEAVQSHTTDFVYDTSGNFVFSGVGIYSVGFAFTGGGEFTYSGEATQTHTFNYLYVGTGEFVHSGSATQTHSCYYLYEGSGDFTYSGTAITIVGFTCVGDGEFIYSGTAIQSYTFSFTCIGSGVFNYSGSAVITIGSAYIGSGELIYSGEATQSHTKDFVYIVSREFTYSGEAICLLIYNFLYTVLIAIYANESVLLICENGSALSVSCNESGLSTYGNESALLVYANESILSIER